ncbi:hypothetical protein L861_13060 [Litchfieldella anticariensis FP35 = DSM 16096]|uniref:Uncharacterized protein n=1 Tax=Litchfieldella anticariensis (strain DSM 16096 / CECT 5854 / CIP 108499 / LMG 22089 / FP35) TaxID=1121939 RepID=S2L7J3_LITA3|nr:hypothetical protein [Halomonas anticariensis]EPC00716.1 hypothetical protein L861_13060 [Halomonas anticariensis FP35 = DSM 16096]
MNIPSNLRRSLTGLFVAGTMSVAASVSAEPIIEVSGFDALNSIDPQELEQLRGREGFKNLVNVQSIQNMESVVSGASFTAGTIVSGGITVEAQALDNFSGVGLFNMMTGNSNAVAMGVNISVYAPQ